VPRLVANNPIIGEIASDIPSLCDGSINLKTSNIQLPKYHQRILKMKYLHQENKNVLSNWNTI